MRGVTKGGVLTIALAALAKPVVADTQLDCSTKKVVIISAPGGETSSTREEDLSFRVDDSAKTLTFAGDGLWLLPNSATTGSAQIAMAFSMSLIAKLAA